MFKRVLAVFVIVLMLMGTGCANNVPVKTTEPEASADQADDQQAVSADPLVILDKDGGKIGAIDGRANCTAVEKGVFYSVFEGEEGAFTGTAEYHCFSLEDHQDFLLGKLEDQGYEAFYARTELNGVIYTLAVKGNPFGSSPIPLLLLAFDPAGRSMKSYTVSEYGFPYAAMAVSDGKLFIMNHEMTEEKADKVYQFDPDSETIKEVLTFSSGKDSLRSVCAADEGFYLLRLKINGGGENELYLDRYDRSCSKVSEQSVNEVLAAAVMNIHGIMNRQDALNELGMNVGRFAVIDGKYMVYENFGLSHVIADLQSGEAVLAKNDTYSVSIGSGSPVVYRIDFDRETAAEPEICGIENGSLRQFSFRPADTHPLIENVSRSGTGTWAVRAAETFPTKNGTEVLYLWTEG